MSDLLDELTASQPILPDTNATAEEYYIINSLSRVISHIEGIVNANRELNNRIYNLELIIETMFDLDPRLFTQVNAMIADKLTKEPSNGTNKE